MLRLSFTFVLICSWYLFLVLVMLFRVLGDKYSFRPSLLKTVIEDIKSALKSLSRLDLLYTKNMKFLLKNLLIIWNGAMTSPRSICTAFIRKQANARRCLKLCLIVNILSSLTSNRLIMMSYKLRMNSRLKRLLPFFISVYSPTP